MSLFNDDLVAPPQAGHYQVLYVDNPWPENGGGKIKRGADKHYHTMKLREIVALNAQFGTWAADDAHMYTWATNNYLPAAFDCIKAAGFRYVTCCTWVKDRPGLGQYFRGKTEHCLFAVRGRMVYRIAPSGKRAQGETVFYSPLFDHCTNEPIDDDDPVPPADLPEAFEAPHPKADGKIIHSRKPAKMRAYIELISGPVPRLECFARIVAPGWDAWGREAQDNVI